MRLLRKVNDLLGLAVFEEQEIVGSEVFDDAAVWIWTVAMSETRLVRVEMVGLC